MQDSDETTYQRRQIHPQIIEYLPMESIGQDVDAEELRSNLQASVKRKNRNYLPWTRIHDAVDVATPILNPMARESFYQVQEPGRAPARR